MDILHTLLNTLSLSGTNEVNLSIISYIFTSYIIVWCPRGRHEWRSSQTELLLWTDFFDICVFFGSHYFVVFFATILSVTTV